MNFAATPPRARRRPGLTPMIDVVFLLLIFFMLAARFGGDTMRELVLPAGDTRTEWQGAPRLVDVSPEALRLNGAEVAEADALPAALAPLLPDTDAPVLIRPRAGATLQRLLDVFEALEAAGLRPVLVEGD